jgi:hypothetical protein
MDGWMGECVDGMDVTRTQGFLWPRHKYAGVCIQEDQRDPHAWFVCRDRKGVFVGLPKETTQGV